MEKIKNYISGEEFEEIGRVGAYESYEWSEFAVLRDLDTGQLFTLSSSGCSCNDLSDSLSAREPLTNEADFIREARQWARDNRTMGEGTQLVAQINNLIRKTQRRLHPKG